jgi:hypothetical protein
MLATYRVCADAFDLGTDTKSGVIAPGDMARLCNMSGYAPQMWVEARAQLCSTHVIVIATINGH